MQSLNCPVVAEKHMDVGFPALAATCARCHLLILVVTLFIMDTQSDSLGCARITAQTRGGSGERFGALSLDGNFLRWGTMQGLSKAFVLSLMTLLAGCAGVQPNTSDAGANDPYESTNRQIFEFNQNADQAVILPVAKTYVAVVPELARMGIHNFLTNLDLPVTFANDILQGETQRAGETLGRFGVNSTLGIAGLLDPASDFGIPYHSEDFGQTLAVYGVGEGPYMVLPFLGPDPPRDAAGQVVDIFLDPFTYVSLREHIYYSAAREFFTVLDLRAKNLDTLQGIERGSVDYYASVRSLYRQLRNNEIRNGKPDVKNLPNL
jgi:phospholipid-binding lipoprotein MlaA